MPTKRHPCQDCSKSCGGKRCRQCMMIHRKNAAHHDRQRFWYLKKKYGLTEDEFWIYWMACRGRCFICENHMELPKKQRGQELNSCCVDHDHITGKTRGLLCSGCNKGIGLLKDSPTILAKAIGYLTCVN